jgi:hypothetical protein
MGAVCYQRSGCLDLGVYTSRFEPLCQVQGPPAVESPLLGYNDLLGGFEELELHRASGSAEEWWVLEREDQGCADASLPATKYPFPLPTP